MAATATVKEFAAWLGFAQSTISTWWNDETKLPEGESVHKLAEKLGLEIYDALEIPRPDEDLHYIQTVWQNLPANARLARIQTRLDRAQNLLQQTEQKHTRSLAARQNLNALSAVKNLPRWYASESPRRVNTTLHTVIESVTITRRPHTLTIQFK